MKSKEFLTGLLAVSAASALRPQGEIVKLNERSLSVKNNLSPVTNEKTPFDKEFCAPVDLFKRDPGILGAIGKVGGEIIEEVGEQVAEDVVASSSNKLNNPFKRWR